jgi:hypothetical protein
VGSEDIRRWRATSAPAEHCDLRRGRQLHTTGNTKFSLAPPNQGLADERGPGYGRWAQTGDREFKLTFYAVLLKEGEVNGYLRVHSTMILADSGNEFTASECRVDFLDVNWKVLDSDNDEVKGTRLEAP